MAAQATSVWAVAGVDALLTRLWVEERLSVRQVAERIGAFAGRPVTRSATIGHIVAIGLSGKGGRERSKSAAVEAVAAKRAELGAARRKADVMAAELRGVEAAAALVETPSPAEGGGSPLPPLRGRVNHPPPRTEVPSALPVLRPRMRSRNRKRRRE